MDGILEGLACTRGLGCGAEGSRETPKQGIDMLGVSPVEGRIYSAEKKCA